MSDYELKETPRPQSAMTREPRQPIGKSYLHTVHFDPPAATPKTESRPPSYNNTDIIEPDEQSELLRRSIEKLNVRLSEPEIVTLPKGEKAALVTIGTEQEHEEYPRCGCPMKFIVALVCVLAMVLVAFVAIQVSRDSNSDRQHEMNVLIKNLEVHYHKQDIAWSSCDGIHEGVLCQQFYIVTNEDIITVEADGICVVTWHKGASAMITATELDKTPEAEMDMIDSDEASDYDDTTDADWSHETTAAMTPPVNITSALLGDPSRCPECLLRWQPSLPEDIDNDFKQPALMISLRFPVPSFYSLVSVICF